MKKNSTLLFMAIILMAIFMETASAQNTSPYWSLAGNSNATSTSKFGTTNAISLPLFTNNTERMRISASGNIGINTANPLTKFHVNGFGSFGNRVTTANATRALNLIDDNAVMRVLRVSASSAPAVELISRTTADGTNVAYWDFYTQPSDASFRIRDRQTGANLDRLTIDHKFGYVGIGTIAPIYYLDVRSPNSSFGNFKAANGYAGVIIDKSSDGQNGYVIHRTGGLDKWTEGMMGNNNFTLYNWGLGANAMTIDINNNFVGLGVTNPEYRLDVGGRMRLRSGNGSAGLWLNNDANTVSNGFIGVLNDTHIGLWGNTGAGWSVLMNTTNGYLGVKNQAPQTELHLKHGVGSGATSGFRIQTAGASNNNWTLYTSNDGGWLWLYYNGNFRGSFDPASGTYTPSSDARVKKNIEKSENVLDKIMQLGVKRYGFIKGQNDKRRYFGMIAQEVEKIFPDLVFHQKGDDGKEFYTMDYGGVGVIAIKGIQELKPVIEKQQEQLTRLLQQNETLQNEVAELKQMVTRLAGEKGIITSGNSGILGMAKPNPANNLVRIEYEAPDASQNARLLITDALGRTVKTLQLTKSGVVNIDISALSRGVYNYSLEANGKTLQTRQMTIQK